MDFWDFNAKYLDSIKPVEQTAGANTPAKSNKWDNAKEDEIKDNKPAENTPPVTQETNDKPPAEEPLETQETNDKPPTEEPAESGVKNND